MLNFIYGVIVTWFLLGLGYSFWWGEKNLYTLLMEIPGGIIQILIEIICFPFMLFYLVFLRHTIKPVDSKTIEKANIWKDSKHLFGPIYICFDWKAKRLCNKIFLFRVKPPVISDKADSPEFFRIGVDK